jgi:hypothetical protein
MLRTVDGIVILAPHPSGIVLMHDTGTEVTMNASPSAAHVTPDMLREAVGRARAEFLEMPGLKLTVAQAARLWSVDPALCRQVFAVLVTSRFLTETSHASFIRAEH